MPTRMILSKEQKFLIRNRAETDSPSFTAAYSFWLLLGLFGAHRFYLHCDKSGLLQLSGSGVALGIIACSIAWGGTPLDGIFFMPGIEDILRATETWQGTALFYIGAALLAGIGLWWLIDTRFIYKNIVEDRIAKVKEIHAYYQA